jgi:hypothetical protein
MAPGGSKPNVSSGKEFRTFLNGEQISLVDPFWTFPDFSLVSPCYSSDSLILRQLLVRVAASASFCFRLLISSNRLVTSHMTAAMPCTVPYLSLCCTMVNSSEIRCPSWRRPGTGRRSPSP